jgi:hypothetical protein
MTIHLHAQCFGHANGMDTENQPCMDYLSYLSLTWHFMGDFTLAASMQSGAPKSLAKMALDRVARVICFIWYMYRIIYIWMIWYGYKPTHITGGHHLISSFSTKKTIWSIFGYTVYRNVCPFFDQSNLVWVQLWPFITGYFNGMRNIL